MEYILTKGAGNQVSNRNKAIEIALEIYDNSFKTNDNNSNISINGDVYRVAAYADPRSKSALVNKPNGYSPKNTPRWYRKDMSGFILVKQRSDGRLMFSVIDKDELYTAIKTNIGFGVSVDWATVYRIQDKDLSKLYPP